MTLAMVALLLQPANLIVNVNGVERIGIVYAPQKSEGAPLVFCFHGHGGGSRQAARSFRVHEEWKEAVVVYLQGLKGVAGITDPEGKKSGWQKDPKTYGDRDLKFVDAALKKLAADYNFDTKRVYAMGHSNGSRFANVLWNQRGNLFAAFGFSGGQGGSMIRTNIPRSIFVIAGRKDPLVPFAGQMLSVSAIKRLLRLDDVAAETTGLLTTYRAPNGLVLKTYLHPGGHEFPSDAVPMMVKFFKAHTLK